MCGIGGAFAYQGNATVVERGELTAMQESMRHRGPDGDGLWLSHDFRAGLCHRRLAIIDLSDGGAQPMASIDGKLHITFNGEIYNYRQLRAELEREGCTFRTNSDTEVLLQLYAMRGEDMVHALRGMFAFGLWDGNRRRLLLARDPFGIKPLYIADDGRTLRFASQVKALLKSHHIDASADPAGSVGFLLWGSVPEPFTFYRGIRAVPAGTWMTLDEGGLRRESRYFRIEESLAHPAEPPLFDGRGLMEALADSVRDHLVADVPVALFLSSGVDSALIAGLAARESRLHAFTLGFEEYRGTANDETLQAEALAARLGIPHSTRWVRRSDFLAEVDSILEAMDQPSIDGVNTYMVSKMAADLGIKVALSGVGGDELFAGYSNYRDIPRLVRARGLLPRWPSFSRAVRRTAERPLRRMRRPKYAGLLEYGDSFEGAYLLRRSLFMPWELDDLLDPRTVEEGLAALDTLRNLERSMSGIAHPRARVAALEMQWYLRNQLLRDADWAGMAHSIEIRTPLVDAKLFRVVAPMLAGTPDFGKRTVAAAVGGDILAPETVERAKTGFSVPVREWLAADAGARPLRHGLRTWALRVSGIQPKKRVIAFLTDAFGGYGGIALYNRDLLHALCASKQCSGVVALPRLMPQRPEPMPDRLEYDRSALGGKFRYLVAALRRLRDQKDSHLVLCCHINLLPLAWMAKVATGAPLALVIYGIDAWQRPGFASRLALRAVDHVISISRVTADRFQSWSSFDSDAIRILPNAIHLDWYGDGPKSEVLLARYGLHGKKVLATVGRLVSTERYKGFDEVLQVLPWLLKEVPNLVYLIMGDGSDRRRLEEKARALGVANHVVFTGFVPEPEKCEHYRLLDAYAMPSRGEGFGFVVLEALACGVPVVASIADGTREAVRDGELGAVVDPINSHDLAQAILSALDKKHGVPRGLEYFSFQNFTCRTGELLAAMVRD